MRVWFSQLAKDGRSFVEAVPGFACEMGSSVIELALLMPLLLLLLVGAVDMGRAYYVAIEVSSAASAAASYGTQKPTDIAGMQSAASLDAGDITGMTSVASWGCECSDGSSASPACTTPPSCSADLVKYVQVNTSVTYVPLFVYPGIPSSLVIKSSSRMRSSN